MGLAPLIGVTGPDSGGFSAWCMTALALKRAGAKPVRITPGRSCNKLRLDGLVIGGGTDVDPFHYGQKSENNNSKRTVSLLDWVVALILFLPRLLFARHSTQSHDPQRDELEQDLIRHALEFQKPVLGICRGAQLMNVTLGGSLHQSIGHFYNENTNNVLRILTGKIVKIDPDCHLHQCLATQLCTVNALHNQSINRLGDDVAVSAKEPSGVVQAIEKRDHPFFIGVQWHPEYMPQSAEQQRLFHYLVRCAGEHRR